VYDELFDEIINEMLRVLEGDSLILDKVAVGETLGWLGDPRDLKAFIPVVGGDYELGLGKITIQPFEIGKYSVTNKWFEEFIKADGYRNRDYWSDGGRKFLEYTKNEDPEFWHSWDARKWTCPNSPVVGVSWYEADAFTRWLSITLKDRYEYRLPDENEWEAAAVGFEKRVYPWGNEWDKNKCNAYETEIRKPSSVGIFKKGDTTDGISDMAGNVWDWTKSDYDSGKELNDFKFEPEMHKLFEQGLYEKCSSKMKEKTIQIPVLRGGSWLYDRNLARCADRTGYYPYDGDIVIGFRCARTKK
jgi:formylglycine-generating enzyme required for sulfatase activity